MSASVNEDLPQSAGVGDLLSGSWELTQRIFENLSFREVACLRAVCKLWADVGAKILDRRRKLHYLTVHPHHVPTTEGKVIISSTPPLTLLEKFFEHIVSKPRYCIGFCNEDWLLKDDVFARDRDKEKVRLAQYMLSSLPTTCDFRLISASGIIGTVEKQYQGHLLESANNVNQELLSLLYNKDQEESKHNKSKDQEESRPYKRSRRSSTTESLGNERPENSSDTSASNDSTLSDSENLNRSCVGYSIEVEARFNSSTSPAEAVTLLLIPHHPGVKLKFFDICEETFFKEYRQEECSTENLVITQEEFNGLTSLSPEDDLKALLFFDVGLDEGFTSAFIKSALLRQNYKMAVGGGVVECFDCGKEDPREVTNQSNLGIAVCGPNVMAVSVIIPKSVGNPKSLDDYMKQLKSCGLPEGQSLAFMFTCCGRGFSWYRRKGNPWFDYNNVETKAFRKFFPNTPIFGFFGGGEIGMSFLPKFSESTDETEDVPPKKGKRRLFHQFTTVIVLLSFL